MNAIQLAESCGAELTEAYTEYTAKNDLVCFTHEQLENFVKKVGEKMSISLSNVLGEELDMTNAACHLGITTENNCGRCKEEKTARNALKEYKSLLETEVVTK